ncbi:mycothiol synthase [Kineococcus sp. SYSU DK004]|uniref:mycothiol synthase n=1 Tax=Kineococcus sp. SYSU DK004 TaxID=3383125 RepID=UPI003D7E3DE2
MSAPGPRAGAQELVRSEGALPAGVAAAVRALAAAASAADGASALSEDALLRLDAAPDGVTHLVTAERAADGAAAGYAQLAAAGDGSVGGELLVHPSVRRRGTGRRLLAAVRAAAGGAPVALWSHGDTPGAAALARADGWRRARELWRMERPAAGLAELVEPELPTGTAVRAFVPGQDDAAWVAVNAAAFADHPEQGRWTVEDLRLRLAEPWFDPRLLLLATGADGGLLASCWMKVAPGPAGAPVGELYVLGVAPSAAGRGLGRALLVRGLRAVVAGSPAPDVVELYVDAGNVPAVRLYRRLGFERAAVDVQYALP